MSSTTATPEVSPNPDTSLTEDVFKSEPEEAVRSEVGQRDAAAKTAQDEAFSGMM